MKLHLGLSSGHHSLFGLPAEAGEPVDVPLEKLDDVLASHPAVDLLKIDAEGAELEIVEGALRTIERSPEIALIVEFGPSHLQRSGHSTREWLEKFTKPGLAHKAIDDVTGALQDRTVEQLEHAESTNLLFARPGSRAWGRAA